MTGMDRRTFVKGVGAAGAATMMAGQGAAAGSDTIDDQFEMDGGLQESLVVFDSNDSAAKLDSLDLEKGYRLFENLAIAHTFLNPDQIETVAGWDGVFRVKRSEKLEYLNDSVSRDSMEVQEAHQHADGGFDGYAGEDVHVVVIDSGLDGSHPAFAGRVEANYRYVDQPLGARDPLWVDVGETPNDEVGHGTHCTGIALGDGAGATGGDYHGMAPKATVTAYNTTQAVYLPYAVAAWNHMLGRAQDPNDDFDPDVVTNSYGVARGTEYNPFDPLNVATWRAYNEGMFIAFAMGNDGALGTGNRFGKAPHIMPVAAATKTINEEDLTANRAVTGFSSRGRKLTDDATKVADQPSKFIEDEVFYDRETLLQNLEDYWAIANGDSRSVSSETRTGRIGAGVNSSPGAAAVDQDTGSTYEQFTAKGNADTVTLNFSFDPEGQWIRVFVYERRGEDDYRQVAAAREEPTKLHDDLSFDVDGGTEYLVEFRPEDSAYADYELTIEQSARLDGDLGDARPISLYRPGVTTHGNSVISTVQPGSALGPLGLVPSEPLYGRLSGTSMATPACAGIAALCIEAYREAGDGSDPDPIDIIRILESTARDFNSEYTAWNAGAGFIDAESAVNVTERFAADESNVSLETGLDAVVDPKDGGNSGGDDGNDDGNDGGGTTFSVSGNRSDDGSAFTAGQTNTVRLTVTNIDGASAVRVTDSVPAGWDVIEEFSEDVKTVKGKTSERQTVVFKGTVAEGGSVEYLVEAPDSTGSGTFGAATASKGKNKNTTFGGTDTNYVVGASTNV